MMVFQGVRRMPPHADGVRNFLPNILAPGAPFKVPCGTCGPPCPFHSFSLSQNTLLSLTQGQEHQQAAWGSLAGPCTALLRCWPQNSSIFQICHRTSPHRQGATRTPQCFISPCCPSQQKLVQACSLKMLNLQETAEVISLSKIQTVQQEESGFAECNSCFLSIAHTVVMLVDSFLAYLHIVSSFHFFLHFLLLLLCSLLPPIANIQKNSWQPCTFLQFNAISVLLWKIL